MRRSEWEDRCKRHPEHRLSRGVCPGCLRDRLAHLSANSSSATTAVVTRASSTSATASSSHSSGAGPSAPAPHRAALPADVSSVHVVFGGASSAADCFVNNVVAFSQPLMPAAAVNNKKPMTTTSWRDDDAAGSETKGKGEEVNNKKKSGKKKKKKKIGKFLSRLVGAEKRRQTGNGDDGELFHSKTMKEKTASKWVFF